jgi:Fe-S cluster biogenesis protein NfuA
MAGEVKEPLTIAERVGVALRSLRPFFQRDGGDIELLSVERGVVVVRLSGACADCPFAHADIQGLVEDTIRQAVPEVRAVEAVLF